MKPLKERFEIVVDAYTKAFDKKHNIHDGWWVADKKGYVYGFNHGGDYVNYEDIRFDIDENLNPVVLKLWMDQIILIENPISLERWVNRFSRINKKALT